MTGKERNKGGQRRYYIINKWKRSDAFDILDDMNEYVTLVQFMDNLGHVCHAGTIDGVWIFDTNFKRALPLVK